MNEELQMDKEHSMPIIRELCYECGLELSEDDKGYVCNSCRKSVKFNINGGNSADGQDR